MDRSVLVTGGAGFIGSHIADELLARGYRVRALDNLLPQVHGVYGRRPEYLDPEVELVDGDIRDPSAVKEALRGVDAVIHLAALVGVGQSMYQIADYVSVNDGGTATLLEALAAQPVERLVVASSMSVYGEGLYRHDDTLHTSVTRSREQLAAHRWEPTGPAGEPLDPVPTPEHKPPWLESVYALSKYDQECLCLIFGRAYGVPTTALRLFNVYGPRQALSNPYTGVLAIFASRLLNDRPPVVFEDGEQRRDFVNVKDVARAFLQALTAPAAAGRTFNVGSGEALTVKQVAEHMARTLGKQNVSPQITGEYRSGDIRHCFADIGAARSVLGYEPRVRFEDGVAELASWLATQTVDDRVDAARQELAVRGLTA